MKAPVHAIALIATLCAFGEQTPPAPAAVTNELTNAAATRDSTDEIDEIEFPRTLRRRAGETRLCRWGRLGRWSR